MKRQNNQERGSHHEEEKLITSALFILLAAAGVARAQNPEQDAWNVLETGMSDSNASERAVAVRGTRLNPSASSKDGRKGSARQGSRSARGRCDCSGKMGSKHSVEKLRELLKDTESPVVMAATQALKTLGDEKAYEVYFAILTGERKSGEGLMDEQMKMLHDPKKLAQLASSRVSGMCPTPASLWACSRRFTRTTPPPCERSLPWRSCPTLTHAAAKRWSRLLPTRV